MVLYLQVISHLINPALALNPPTLPQTVPNELAMAYGLEDDPITLDYTWYVPHKFYRLTKFTESSQH